MKNFYLIQGILFYNYEQSIFDAHKVMYAGKVFPINKNGIFGEVTDCFGESVLRDVLISPKELKFIKEYVRGVFVNEIFQFNYRYKNGIWRGRFEGEKIKGETNCIFTKISSKFFSPTMPKQKKEIKYTTNVAAMKVHLKKGLKNVVSNGSESRKRGSLISR